MVARLRVILGLMGCHDGPHDLCLPPYINTTPALHSSIFWLHRSHIVLFTRCKFWLLPLLLATIPQHNHESRLTLLLSSAEEYHLDPLLCHHPACLFALVSCQLFPYGLKRSAPRHHIWRKTSCCLDVRLKSKRARILGSYMKLAKHLGPWSLYNSIAYSLAMCIYDIRLIIVLPSSHTPGAATPAELAHWNLFMSSSSRFDAKAPRWRNKADVHIG